MFHELQPRDEIILATNRNHCLADTDRYFAAFRTISSSRFQVQVIKYVKDRYSHRYGVLKMTRVVSTEQNAPFKRYVRANRHKIELVTDIREATTFDQWELIKVLPKIHTDLPDCYFEYQKLVCVSNFFYVESIDDDNIRHRTTEIVDAGEYESFCTYFVAVRAGFDPLACEADLRPLEESVFIH